jgi:hypothetical protein
MSMNFNNDSSNDNSKPQTQRPHLKRAIFFFILTAVIIGLFLYQLPGHLARIDQANKAVDEAKEQVRLAKIRVAEAQARVDYYNNN